MGLGNRNAQRHETLAFQRYAVNAADFADFTAGQRVMTVDGIAGKVSAVEDGPYPGTEQYRVELDRGMGGGLYTSSQLSPLPAATAVEHHTAVDDYPELGSILSDRPDIAAG